MLERRGISPHFRYIHHVIAEYVEKAPEAQAVDGWVVSFSYGQLDDASGKLAA